MRNVRVALLVASGIVVLVLLGIFGFALSVGQRVVTEMKGEASTIFAEIANPWSPNKLVELAAPSLKENVSDAELKKLVLAASQDFGELKAIPTMPTPAFPDQDQATADFKFVAEFEKSKADIELSIVNIKGKWMVGRFGVYKAKKE